MRDNKWLEDKLEDIWENHYADVARKNKVIIKFGKRAKRTLGSIKFNGELSPEHKEYNIHDDKRVTQITVTRLFQDNGVPEVVIVGTIAHEVVHYAHGFNSPLNQVFDHPHRGGIVKKEMVKRGLGDVYKESELWLKQNWINYLKQVRK